MGRNSRTLIDQSLYADDKDFLLKVGWPYPQYRELIDPGTYVAMCKLDHLFDPKPTTSLQILDGSNQWLCPRCDRKVAEGHGWRTFPLAYFTKKHIQSLKILVNDTINAWWNYGRSCLFQFFYTQKYVMCCAEDKRFHSVVFAIEMSLNLPQSRLTFFAELFANGGVCAQGMPKTKFAISRCDLEWVWKRFAQEKLFELKS